MPSFSLDTSCLIAAVCSWHETHQACADAVEERLDRGEPLVMAAHTLLEAYAVLTRLPPPHRLAPRDAWTLIQANFVDGRSVVSQNGDDYVRLLEQLAGTGVAGGRSYDALIAGTLGSNDVATLLTLNPRHFHGLQADILIVDPGAG